MKWLGSHDLRICNFLFISVFWFDFQVHMSFEKLPLFHLEGHMYMLGDFSLLVKACSLSFNQCSHLY